MYRTLIVSLCLLMLSALPAFAESRSLESFETDLVVIEALAAVVAIDEIFNEKEKEKDEPKRCDPKKEPNGCKEGEYCLDLGNNYRCYSFDFEER